MCLIIAIFVRNSIRHGLGCGKYVSGNEQLDFFWISSCSSSINDTILYKTTSSAKLS